MTDRGQDQGSEDRRVPGPGPGHPGFRVRGPVDEAAHGEIDDADPAPDDPDRRSGVTAGLGGGTGTPSESAESAGPGEAAEPGAEGGHVTADLDWTETGEDDPDAGSGRT